MTGPADRMADKENGISRKGRTKLFQLFNKFPYPPA